MKGKRREMRRRRKRMEEESNGMKEKEKKNEMPGVVVVVWLGILVQGKREKGQAGSQWVILLEVLERVITRKQATNWDNPQKGKEQGKRRG